MEIKKHQQDENQLRKELDQIEEVKDSEQIAREPRIKLKKPVLKQNSMPQQKIQHHPCESSNYHIGKLHKHQNGVQSNQINRHISDGRIAIDNKNIMNQLGNGISYNVLRQFQDPQQYQQVPNNSKKSLATDLEKQPRKLLSGISGGQFQPLAKSSYDSRSFAKVSMNMQQNKAMLSNQLQDIKEEHSDNDDPAIQPEHEERKSDKSQSKKLFEHQSHPNQKKKQDSINKYNERLVQNVSSESKEEQSSLSGKNSDKSELYSFDSQRFLSAQQQREKDNEEAEQAQLRALDNREALNNPRFVKDFVWLPQDINEHFPYDIITHDDNLEFLFLHGKDANLNASREKLTSAPKISQLPIVFNDIDQLEVKIQMMKAKHQQQKGD